MDTAGSRRRLARQRRDHPGTPPPRRRRERISSARRTDGQVGAVRTALDRRGSADVGILAYSAEYASGFYGPFQKHGASSLPGDRTAPALQVTEALAETALDVSEGADIVMVKPALPYLDVLRAVADASPVPVAVSSRWSTRPRTVGSIGIA